MNRFVMHRGQLLVALGFFLAVTLVGVPEPHARQLSLRDAMQQAVMNNPNLKAAGYEADARLQEQHSVRGRFLPVIKTSANVLYWDDKFSAGVDLSAITDILGDLAPLLPQTSQDKLANLKNSSPSIQIRDRLTYKASVTIAQPLIQLYGIYFNHAAAGGLAKAAAYDLESARLQLELEVARTYYGMLAGMRMTDSLAVALEQVGAYESQVRAFLDAGRVERNALMKVEVQQAELQKAQFAADKAVRLSRARLNVLMGQPQDTEFEPEPIRLDDEPDHPSPGPEPLSSYVDHALAKRPDLLSIRQTMNASRARRQAAISAMLPELNAVFNYDYNGGMGEIQPENQYFVGLTLSWNIWEWGASYYQVKAAESRMDQAASRLAGQSQQVELEVKSRKLDLEEALQGHGVALVQRKQAAENLRIEKARYAAGQTTTADLLQAQAIDVKSANDLILAEMKVLESRQALLVAGGYDLLDQTHYHHSRID
ncbi:MAG: TolC family protein [Deltaproteobacteria bacterium]|nr:TolC family protein [Deltaproteobacteria bacterium]